MSRTVALLVAIITLGAGAPLRAQDPVARLPFNQIVDRHVVPQVTYLFDRLIAEKRDMTIDGMKAFSGDDPFLPGKIAIALTDLLAQTPRDDPRFARYLAAFRETAELTLGDRNDSWGIYYYVSALNALRRQGLLEQAVSPATLAVLRQRLDWRVFVNQTDFSLINLPSNYYGVAFSIARLRFLLGWEDESASRRLLERMTNHYATFSGEFGFSDETQGEGRFDRYSILLIGEICQRFIETDLAVTPQLEKWLRGAVNVMLVRLNANGDGFDFGRSIGPYGETAFLEVLSAAAVLGVLTPEEKEMAYTFSSRVAAKYATFWYDSAMKSVNLWEKGRRTDAYRGKFRILGENLSLAHQVMYTNRLWNRIGLRDRPQSPRFDAWLRARPPVTLTWFAKGEYDRALATMRDGARIISLPIVNGGAGQHMNNPYFPIPFSRGLVAGSADATFPQLVPRFSLADSTVLMPLAFERGIAMERRGTVTRIGWHQTEMDRMGTRAPVKDDRMRVDTRYEFRPGVMSRTDVYAPRQPLELQGIEMEFATFSDGASVLGRKIVFSRGDVRELDVTGFDACTADRIDGDPLYRSPERAMTTRVRCTAGRRSVSAPFTIGWTLRYR